MNIDIIKTCEEIQTKTKELQEIRADFLYYNQLTPEGTNLLIQKSIELEELKSQTVSLYLDIFVEELARVWNTPESALSVTIGFDQASELPTKCSKTEYIQYVKGLGGLSITLNINEKGSTNSKNRFARLVTELDLNAMQKNGKKLEELVDVVSNGDCLNLLPNETKLKLCDYKNLIFTYTLGEISDILKHSYETSSDISKVFLTAIDKCSKEQEETEPNAE